MHCRTFKIKILIILQLVSAVVGFDLLNEFVKPHQFYVSKIIVDAAFKYRIYYCNYEFIVIKHHCASYCLPNTN